MVVLTSLAARYQLIQNRICVGFRVLARRTAQSRPLLPKDPQPTLPLSGLNGRRSDLVFQHPPSYPAKPDFQDHEDVSGVSTGCVAKL